MSDDVITQGDTFLADYVHGASLAGVTFTAVAVFQPDGTKFTVSFFVIDEAAGIGQFRAATDLWPAGLYQFQYRQVGGSIVTHSYPITQFVIERSLFT